MTDEVFPLVVAQEPRDEIIRKGVSCAFRVALKWRSAFRLNLILLLERGHMHPRRSADEDRLLDKAAQIAGGVLNVSERDARLLLKSIIFCGMRYALLNDDELRRVVGATRDEPIHGVHAVIESHLIALTRSHVRDPDVRLR